MKQLIHFGRRVFLRAEFIKFVLVGVVSALLEYLLYFVFKISFEYLIANIIAFGLTNIVTYILTKRFVFVSTNANKLQEGVLFFVCLLGALLVNQLVLWTLVEFAAISDEIAKVVAIAVTVTWNFFTRKHLVFRNRVVVPQRATSKYESNTLSNFRNR